MLLLSFQIFEVSYPQFFCVTPSHALSSQLRAPHTPSPFPSSGHFSQHAPPSHPKCLSPSFSFSESCPPLLSEVLTDSNSFFCLCIGWSLAAHLGINESLDNLINMLTLVYAWVHSIKQIIQLASIYWAPTLYSALWGTHYVRKCVGIHKTCFYSRAICRDLGEN